MSFKLHLKDNPTKEKRFIINDEMNLFDDKIETYELSCVVDTDNKTFYFIVDSIANVEMFVERLNNLNEENKQLKHRVDELELLNDGLEYVLKNIKQINVEVNLND